MNRDPLHAITDDDVRAYQRDGVVCLRGMFDRDWIDRMVAAVAKTMENPGHRSREATKPGKPGRFHTNTHMWRWNDDMRALALESPMVGIAAALLKPERLAFFYDQLFVKEPGTGEITHWHHDLPYWPMAGGDIVSIWLALTPVDLESSGLQYIAGSHRWNRMFRAVTPDEDPRLMDPNMEPCPDYFDEKHRAGHNFLSWSLEPGDVICHHPLTVHGAAGNASMSRKRIGLSLRYTGNDARWEPRPFAFRVEGGPENVLKAGDPPVLDGVFPVVWTRSGGRVSAAAGD